MQKKYAKMLYSSPIGSLSLVADDHYLYGIWVQEQKHFERGIGDETIEVVVSHPILDPVIACLDAYFKGKSQDLSNLPLAPKGTDFEKRVWSYLQRIPYGQTVTYGQIYAGWQWMFVLEALPALVLGVVVLFFLLWFCSS